MGTGTFLDINTGNKPQQSVGGKELEFILFVNEISLFSHSLNFCDTPFLFYIKDILWYFSLFFFEIVNTKFAFFLLIKSTKK